MARPTGRWPSAPTTPWPEGHIGEPARVTLERLQDDLAADGRDVAFYHATVVDADGNRCFNDFRTLRLSVQGPADLAGPTQRVCRGGKLGFAVHSTGQAGRVSVTAGGEGLSAATAELEAG